jgi:hypothetical protein
MLVLANAAATRQGRSKDGKHSFVEAAGSAVVTTPGSDRIGAPTDIKIRINHWNEEKIVHLEWEEKKVPEVTGWDWRARGMVKKNRKSWSKGKDSTWAEIQQ